MIDLGERGHEQLVPKAGARVRPASSRRILPRLVAVFVAGTALGVIGTNELRDSRDERERAATVALVALPASVSGSGMDASGTLRLDAELTLVNAGPSPITVRGVEGQRPGVLVQDTGRPRLVRPGGTGRIEVTVTLRCAAASGSEPLSIRFTVETEDGRVREVRYPVALVGSRWQESCQRPR